MKIKIIILLLFVCSTIINSTQACCMSFEGQEKELYDNSDVIFIGKETSREEIELTGMLSELDDIFEHTKTEKVTIDILEPIKGLTGEKIFTVLSSVGWSCDFSLGETSLVYLTKGSDGLYHGSCCDVIGSSDSLRYVSTLSTFMMRKNTSPFTIFFEQGATILSHNATIYYKRLEYKLDQLFI